MPPLLDILVLAAAVQGGLLALALGARQTNRLANRVLAVLIAALSLMLLLGLAERRWAFSSTPGLLGLTAPLPFLFGPLLYLYVLVLTRPAPRFEPRWLAHGAPFAAAAVYWLVTFYLLPGPVKIALARDYSAGAIAPPPGLRLLDVALLAQAMAYLLASWLCLRRYSRRIEGWFSDVARINLRWLTAMVLANAAVWSIVIVSGLLRQTGMAPAALRGFSQAIRVGSALIVFLTGYVSLWQPDLFEKAQAARPLPKYQRNRLEDTEASALAAKVMTHLRDRRLYRDPALTLQMLADAVGATPHTLSQVLNLHLQKSFFVLVNSLRVEDLKMALADPRQSGRGVLDLALEAGFNSKSSLNSFFKRHTGLTPSEFRRRQAPARTARISTG